MRTSVPGVLALAVLGHLSLALAPAAARAGEPPPSVIVTATASSELATYPAWMAVDNSADTRAWCVDRGIGASITLTFDQPIAITSLDLRLGMYPAGGAAAPDHLQITAGKQTVEATGLNSSNLAHVALDGSAVSSVTLKIVSMPPVKASRACIASIRVSSPSTYYYRFIQGIDRRALTALAAFARDLDTALKGCDGRTLAAAVKGPVVHTHTPVDSSMDRATPLPGPKTVTYKTAADLVAACTREGSPLARGYAGGSHDATLADELAHGSSPEPGKLSLGDNQTHDWVLAWTGAWSVSEIQTSDALGDIANVDFFNLVGAQLDALATRAVPADTVTDDATFVVLDATRVAVKAADLGAALGVTDAKHDDPSPQIVLARDGESAWLSFTSKLGKREVRASEVAVKRPGGWRIAGGMWSVAQGNDAVNKAAQAGTLAKLAPLPPTATGDDLLAAVTVLQTGPIDKLAAARADLVALGSGPGERSIGGAKLAAPWAAGWAKHVTFGGALMTRSPSGRTAWVAIDALLDKAKPKPYQIPFRLFFVFDRAGTGAWSLVHVQFAVPPPA